MLLTNCYTETSENATLPTVEIKSSGRFPKAKLEQEQLFDVEYLTKQSQLEKHDATKEHQELTLLD